MSRVKNVREALCALCRVLSSLDSYWDPEMFRKSKFNSPEAASKFWNLLFHLLEQIFSSKHNSSPSTYETFNMADRVRYVKSLLLFQGYGRLEFHRLPNHGEEGSREILLAFSWLLHKMKILEILLEKKRVKVGDHITICLCSQDMSIQKCKDMSSSTKEDADFRFLQWLNGKLRFCWRALYASHLEECAVLYKLLKALKCEISYLEAYMEWKHIESVYWQWMDTVLESACEEERSLAVHNMNTICTFVPSSSQPPYIPTDIKVLKCLRDTEDQLHKLAILRNSSSEEQIEELEIEFSEKELKRIKQEVKKRMEPCKAKVVDAKDLHGSYRLLLKEHNKDCSVNDVHVTEVTKCLQSAICKMETEYYGLQDQCRKRLDDITEQVEGITCIHPARG
ncbi:tubulin epsilon and delta complex protein 1 isoform X2 [Eleutherodactylus coqui]|uniref:tubulin epsilon and delta complex protein 1 isoform X2 n=1 Tax=Eleutherodactylus coqui TaxID=57060 RepID=UPI003461902C